MLEEHQLDLERTYSTIRNAARQERFVSYGDLAAANDVPSLGRQYRIGHSYVTPPDGAPGADGGKWFRQVVETEIGPLLEEYWYDAPDKAEQACKRLLTGLPE